MLKRERNLIKMKEVELLAPAGSYEKAKIAFLYGADAVYCGTSSLSLRTRADMQDDDLEKTIKSLTADIETLEEKLPEAIRGEFAFSVDKLSAIISDKETSKKEIEANKSRLQKQLDEVSVESNELLAYVDAMPKWSEIFKDSDTQTKQMILSTLIDKIIVKDDDITIKFKIRLDNFLDEKLLESSGVDVPQQRLQLYDHVLHSIRPEIHVRAQHLPEYLGCGRGNVPELSFQTKCETANPDAVL